jgi:BirA family biotin operon repressor/biotin-[acetyl-CoA-carboxylase] ligase
MTDVNLARVGVRPIRHFERVDSTNDLALAWLKDGAPDGAVVLADEQAQGRGRLGRRWFAPAGTALLLSYVFRTKPSVAHRASMLGALAVAEVCESLGCTEVGIKYPNDVQVAGRKVAGVLAEAVTLGTQTGVVLGIGLNVSVSFEGTALETTAVSLATVLEAPIERSALLPAVLTCLDTWRGQIETDRFFDAWHSRLNMLNQWVHVQSGDETIEGLALGVDSFGRLQLRMGDGSLREVIAGDLLVMK